MIKSNTVDVTITQAVSAIDLTADPGTIGEGGNSILTMSCGASGVELALYENGNELTTVTTNKYGIATQTITFEDAGTYSFIAKYGNVVSNQATVTVKAPTTCTCCQKYNAETGSCETLVPSAIDLEQPNSNPTEILECTNTLSMNAYAFCAAPCFRDVGDHWKSTNLHHITFSFTGTVRDADGNPVCNNCPNCSGNYSLWLWLSSSGASFKTGNNGYTWDIKLAYSISPASQNSPPGSNNAITVSVDGSGNFSGKLWVDATTTSHTNGNLNIINEDNADVFESVTLNAGFHNGVAVTSIPMEFTIEPHTHAYSPCAPCP